MWVGKLGGIGFNKDNALELKHCFYHLFYSLTGQIERPCKMSNIFKTLHLVVHYNGKNNIFIPMHNNLYGFNKTEI